MNNQNSNINNLDKDYLNEFCRKWNLSEFSVFGSFARSENRDDSDIDILVDFQKDHKASLFDLIKLKYELEQYFKTKVDLLTLNGVIKSSNEYRKQEILTSKVVLYESR